ncbi:MAG TPA: DUF3857 domain-containing protein [Cytophagaceae bacterium]|jgi:transglutaminase-like putative cysteine protease|nr:DUF3857 domain-containing protein [Cytophagaceae bacterium]
MSQSNTAYEKLLLLYPDNPLIILNNTEKINIEIKENKLDVSASYFSEYMFMDTKAGFYSEKSIEYSKLEKITKIEASSFIPTAGGGYKEIKVKKFETTDKISTTVFYDGYKNISFLYPSLQPGAKSTLSYTKEISEPRLLGTHFFQNYAPILKGEFSVSAPSNVELDWKLFNMPDTSFTYEKTSHKNTTTHTWKVTNVKKYKAEENDQSVQFSLPHINVWIKSYQIGNNLYPFLSDEKSLYQWYYSLTKDVNKEESNELKKVVDSITSGISDELQKVKLIYYWVQDNIKYIAVEDGMGGFIPRSGKTVFERRYGDCKDMASIITKMLGYAGIKSYLTWIGTRSIPYRYSEVPTPIVDNHMIATYKNKNDYYFLDGTGRGTPYNTPTAFIQGKEALLGIDSNHFEIVEVKVIPAEQNKFSDSIQITLDKTKIIGSGVCLNSGYFNTTLSHKLAESNKEEKLILKNYLNKSSNKLIIDSAKVSNVFGRENPVIINYHFNIENYAQQNQDETYINLHLDKDYSNNAIEPERTRSIEREHTTLLSYYIRFNIPTGYKVEYLPPNVKVDYGKYAIDIDYKKTETSVVLTKEIRIEELLTERKNFDTWNKMIKELKKAYSEVLIIKKIK